MPLRDHFRPPVFKLASWEGLHGMLPAALVQQLSSKLPAGFTAEPRVHLGSSFELDVSTYEEDPSPGYGSPPVSGGAAPAPWAPPAPTALLEIDLGEQYEYEVLVYDRSRGRVLVAAVEIVSPANKDRPKARRAFVAKCAALLQQRVCVSIVDLVTTMQFNLYADLLDLIEQNDPAFGTEPPPTYAVTCRGRQVEPRPRLEVWAYPLTVGSPLPTLPIWLDEVQSVALDLESSYEDACRALRIP